MSPRFNIELDDVKYSTPDFPGTMRHPLLVKRSSTSRSDRERITNRSTDAVHDREKSSTSLLNSNENSGKRISAGLRRHSKNSEITLDTDSPCSTWAGASLLHVEFSPTSKRRR
eukprot:TRINITY_DN3877_c0_g1_i1.p1 TRINITY_DN3877_c0_g1~~TRINITY_DN3877_c0_g1_i1.p1  ORF type:complete len:114 (-),score=15.50 TRINITY_DN3877_c0_g1_i1:249-590(-)